MKFKSLISITNFDRNILTLNLDSRFFSIIMLSHFRLLLSTFLRIFLKLIIYVL